MTDHSGLLPIIQWLAALHPKPLATINQAIKQRSLAPLSLGPKAIPIIQAWSLAVYYPSEHIWWFNAKGLLGLSPAGATRAGEWLMRSWG